MNQPALPGIPASRDGMLDFNRAEVEALRTVVTTLSDMMTKHSIACTCVLCKLTSIALDVTLPWRPGSLLIEVMKGPDESPESFAARQALAAAAKLDAGPVVRSEVA